MNTIRSYVFRGQYGYATSWGMDQLAKQLNKFGPTFVYNWDDVSYVIPEINKQSGKVGVVGFSLGANDLGFINDRVKRRIELGVAYDPSRLSPLVRRTLGGTYIQTVTMYDRLVCYYHPDAWMFGGSKYEGPGVVTVDINIPHLWVHCNQGLHNRTIWEFEQLARK